MIVRQGFTRVAGLALLLAMSGCAAHYSAEAVQDPYGFWSGIWHGIVFPIALLANIVSWVVSLVGISFLDSIQIIGRPNTGFWYYAGFVLGLSAVGGGGAS